MDSQYMNIISKIINNRQNLTRQHIQAMSQAKKEEEHQKNQLKQNRISLKEYNNAIDSIKSHKQLVYHREAHLKNSNQLETIKKKLTNLKKMYSSQASNNRYQELTLVKLSKNSIDFPYIPDKYLHFILKITNESNFHVAYKFKSTQPQKYLVKTDQNIIEPHKEAIINFTMHPDLIKDKLQTFKDNFQLVVSKLSNNKESLENIFKNNKSVIESQVAKLPVKIINPNGEVINNQNKMTATTKIYQPAILNGAFETAGQNQRQNLISVDLKDQQDPNLKEAERYNQSIQTMTANNTRATPNGHTQEGSSKGGKSKVIKAVAIGVFIGIAFTVIQNMFASHIDAINPLNL
ncbi:hypothetical protein ABPG72_003142 [Tetrahymena utriculariae]